MKICFVLFCPDGPMKTFYSSNKEGLVPLEVREKYAAQYKFLSHDNSTDVDAFALKVFTENIDYVCVALVHPEAHVPTFSKLMAVELLPPDTDLRKVGNLFSQLTSLWTKRISFLLRIFEDQKFQAAMLLPIRNFDASELRELNMVLPSRLGDKTFDLGPHVEKRVSSLRDRLRPSPRGRYATKYFVDDAGRYFEYGHEHHSRPQTKGNGHTAACEVSATVRFGLRHTSERHFNVTKPPGQISGSGFQDCHGASGSPDPASHLNMFPNDYFG